MSNSLTAEERRRLEDAGLTPVNETTDKHGVWSVEVKPSPEWLKRMSTVTGWRITYEGGDFLACRE